MKNTYILIYRVVLSALFALFLINGLKAQEFAPKSAIWYYSAYDNSSSIYEDYATMQYDHDTLIKGLRWKYLKLISHDDNGKPGKIQKHYIVKADSNIVRLWMGTYSTVLYNYSAGQKIGDTMIYKDTAVPFTTHLVLKTIDSITISGKRKKRFTYLAVVSGYPSWTVIEGIGALERVKPDFTATTGGFPLIRKMRCYHDSSISYRAPGAHQCDSIVHVGIRSGENIIDPTWNAWPNPCKNNMILSYNGAEMVSGEIFARIYTSTGQYIYEKRISTPSHTELDMQHLQPGLYFIVIQALNANTSLKIIKY
jgi:hypothetical protein